ncbi:MAG: hypothetical protein A2X61_10915 [Ignavibacteria bacterium GWB2_35_12]|nr:MAG: hypothetical protein A2X63_05130 [Ignavibacteria bacterium GWA2_35_8]OGU40321.1 MAG: hypothetical protein A2X61_10915 [Ignavibacteria bacterium GWB2_35_12]OGU93057.1 MAG: hypothetical protein A2220_16035 [Ignavibacteria bacterium RIFOXYA2_FULL_35_10]OGV24749.1 MAG: hypothetical protein A2475_14140 [Ignavibacteria bacterium RIFOXYC2_FULL_35_21]
MTSNWLLISPFVKGGLRGIYKVSLFVEWGLRGIYKVSPFVKGGLRGIYKVSLFVKGGLRGILLFLLLFNSTGLNAQIGSFGVSDARSMGMGNTFNSNTKDVYSSGKNPALLIPSDTSETLLKFMLPGISSDVYTNSIPPDEVEYFFGGPESRDLTEGEKDRLYGYFAEGNGKYNYYASFTPLAIVYKPSGKIGAFGFTMSDFVSGGFTIPSSLAQLALKGNEAGKTYSLDDLRFQTWWLRSYSLSYSKEVLNNREGFIKNINAGISIKYISGFAYTGIEKVSSSFQTGEKNVLNGNYYVEAYSSFSDDLAVRYDYDTVTHVYDLNYFSTPAGSGLGLDIGFSAELDSGITVGLAITDIGSINWSSNVAKHISQKQLYIDDLFNKEQLDSVTDIGSSESKPVADYMTTLPTCLRFGISVLASDYLDGLPGSLLLALDYNQGLNNKPSNSTTPRFSLGTEWQPFDIGLSILTGLSHDETYRFNWSLGLGYSSSLIEAYLSTLDIISTLSPNNTKPHASFAFNLTWKVMGN